MRRLFFRVRNQGFGFKPSITPMTIVKKFDSVGMQFPRSPAKRDESVPST